MNSLISDDFADPLCFLLVEDHPLYAEGFIQAISSLYGDANIEHVTTGRLALELLRHTEFDLVFLDVNLPDISGLQILSDLKYEHLFHPITLITGQVNSTLTLQAKQLGVLGVISKRQPMKKLHTIVDRMLSGISYFDKETAGYSIAKVPEVEPLTQREMQVLNVLAEGLSNKAVCTQLAISDSTLKTHLRAIYQKLDVNNRTACVVKAIRTGLL